MFYGNGMLLIMLLQCKLLIKRIVYYLTVTFVYWENLNTCILIFKTNPSNEFCRLWLSYKSMKIQLFI